MFHHDPLDLCDFLAPPADVTVLYVASTNALCATSARVGSHVSILLLPPPQIKMVNKYCSSDGQVRLCVSLPILYSTWSLDMKSSEKGDNGWGQGEMEAGDWLREPPPPSLHIERER